jgi:hypothetical protein
MPFGKAVTLASGKAFSHYVETKNLSNLANTGFTWLLLHANFMFEGFNSTSPIYPVIEASSKALFYHTIAFIRSLPTQIEISTYQHTPLPACHDIMEFICELSFPIIIGRAINYNQLPAKILDSLTSHKILRKYA